MLNVKPLWPPTIGSYYFRLAGLQCLHLLLTQETSPLHIILQKANEAIRFYTSYSKEHMKHLDLHIKVQGGHEAATISTRMYRWHNHTNNSSWLTCIHGKQDGNPNLKGVTQPPLSLGRTSINRWQLITVQYWTEPLKYTARKLNFIKILPKSHFSVLFFSVPN